MPAGRPSMTCCSAGARQSTLLSISCSFDGEDIRIWPLKERRALLDKIVRRHGMQRTEIFIGQGRPLFSAVCKLDLEGIVAKRLADPYRPRTKWWKIPNRSYSQKEGRAELFVHSTLRRLHAVLCAIGQP